MNFLKASFKKLFSVLILCIVAVGVAFFCKSYPRGFIQGAAAAVYLTSFLFVSMGYYLAAKAIAKVDEKIQLKKKAL